MATPTHATHVPPLGAHVREDVGNHLQDTLVELIDLSLLGKQLHWSVVGPNFRPLHEHLDELVDSWREMADTVAERAVAIGISLHRPAVEPGDVQRVCPGTNGMKMFPLPRTRGRGQGVGRTSSGAHSLKRFKRRA